MTSENPQTREIINRDLEGIIEPDEVTFEPLDLTTRVIPRLMGEAIESEADPDLKGALEKVQELVKRRDVGIVYSAKMQPATTLENDLTFKRVRASQREEFMLWIQLNPTITYKLDSQDDHKKAVSRTKDVMLQIFEEYEDLVRNRQFMPVSAYGSENIE